MSWVEFRATCSPLRGSLARGGASSLLLLLSSVLLDLRFADDAVFFASSENEAAMLLDLLVDELAKVGLLLNAAKTVALTTQAQPPEHLNTKSGRIKTVQFHKWLGCIIDVGSRQAVLKHHLQAASKAFHASKEILLDRMSRSICV